jgi:hypothetical protein
MTVVRPGDHGGAVIAGILSDQYSGAWHRAVSSFLIFRKYSRFPEKVQDPCSLLFPFPVEFPPGTDYNEVILSRIVPDPITLEHTGEVHDFD